MRESSSYSTVGFRRGGEGDNMSENENVDSGMSFWNACENLAVVPEDVLGEQIEMFVDEIGSTVWNVEMAGMKRLNSEGEECDGAEILDEEFLRGIQERCGAREEDMFLVGVEFEDEYFDSLSVTTWGMEQKCVYCKDIFTENMKLSEKICTLEGKNICLQNIKTELLEQLVETKTANNTLEKELSDLQHNLTMAKQEKENLECKMKKLENELYWKAQPAPPPAPPPPPPKSFLSNLKLPFKKKTKRSMSMPENMHVIVKQAPMMTLSEAVLDAIKNKAYSLRPLGTNDTKKAMKSREELGIAQILARRMAMGYGEEEEVKESSIISIMSNGTVYI